MSREDEMDNAAAYREDSRELRAIKKKLAALRTALPRCEMTDDGDNDDLPKCGEPSFGKVEDWDACDRHRKGQSYHWDTAMGALLRDLLGVPKP